MSKSKLLYVISLLFLLGFLLIFGKWYSDGRNLQRRYCHISPYAVAVGDLRDGDRRFPLTLDELERSYNEKSLRKAKCPIGIQPRPEYRPVQTTRPGRYIVLIETFPSGIEYSDRCIVVSDWNGTAVQIEVIPSVELSKRLEIDNESRRAQ